MKKITMAWICILCLGTGLQQMHAQTQVNKNEKIKENREEKSTFVNGKTIREELISVEISGDYEKKSYEYPLNLNAGDSLIMDSQKGVSGFQILEGDKVVSGPGYLLSWKSGPFSQAHTYMVRVPLDLSAKKNLHFSLRFKHIQ
ncbi:MAG TPA: hypothetical protein VNZ86_14845 [Bacteroidia bacterium]|nr:hypothetical protein [Bacteroidia bacterium]